MIRRLAALKGPVYLTIDVDGLEVHLCPGTGTPQPGGLGWYETLALIREIARQKRIVAADLVELAPIEGLAAPDFLAARLAAKIVGYVSGRPGFMLRNAFPRRFPREDVQ